MRFFIAIMVSFSLLSLAFSSDPLRRQLPVGGLTPINRPSIGIVCSDKLKIILLKKNSAFEKAGGKLGDVLLKVGNVKVESIDDMNKVAKDFKTNAMVKIEVQRGNKIETLDVKIGNEQVLPDSCLFPPELKLPEAIPSLGIGYLNGPFEEAEVTSFRKDSTFEKAGGKLGDVIKKIDGKDIKHGCDIIYAIYKLKVGTEVDVQIDRDGKAKTLKVKIGQAVPPVPQICLPPMK